MSVRSHCHMIAAGELTAVIGDAARDGVGGRQYCGVWSLTSKHHVFNAFGNSYAGLLPGEVRGKSPSLELIDGTSAALVRSADEHRPVDVRATYRARVPYYIDHELTFTDRSDVRRADWPYREVSWCCYMNCPEDRRIHFLSDGRWLRHVPPMHGRESNVAPGYLPDDQIETLPPQHEDSPGRWSPFHHDRISARFDLPFYYGRVGPMVLILIFDQPRWLRFFVSPSGAGSSLVPEQKCPAWDFEWIIPPEEYAVGRSYNLRMRAVYKRFESDEDVLAEYRRCMDELGYERV